jgi:hypothetical protein
MNLSSPQWLSRSVLRLLGPALVLLLLGPLLLSSCLPAPSIVRPTPTAIVLTVTPVPNSFPTLAPSPTPSPTVAITSADLAITSADVAVYPGPENYSGDILSFDVTPRNVGTIPPAEINVRIYRGSVEPSNVIASGIGGYPTFDGVPRIRLSWAWDTAGLVGDQTLIAWLDPDDTLHQGDEDPGNNIVTFTVHLRPAEEIPAPEAGAAWTMTHTACCDLHYLTGTSSDRDIPTITVVANQAVAGVQQQLGVTLSSPLNIYFISRVIGHGGYAYEAVGLSYLDRHYAGFDLAVVVRHEATHVLDGKLVKSYPPAILREGLAVWVAGGHFKPEPIPQRAAALLELDRYIPLDQLANDFYRQQHEIGYLEGAAFIAYLVDTHGWDAFRGFYGSFPNSSEPAADLLDSVLQENFGRGLAETEDGFRAWLAAHPPTPEQVRDLVDTISLFDAVRRYQAVLDPSAYWMSGWLPNPTEGERRGIVADFIRHPRAPENIALEAMLIAAREGMRQGQYDQAEALVAGVNRVLDTGDFRSAPEADYLALVQAVAAAGWEAQQVAMHGDIADVWAIAEWPVLQKLTYQRTGAGWALAIGGLISDGAKLNPGGPCDRMMPGHCLWVSVSDR